VGEDSRVPSIYASRKSKEEGGITALKVELKRSLSERKHMLKEKIIAWLEKDEGLIFEPMMPVSETGTKVCPLQFNFAGLICRAAGFTPQSSNGYCRLPMNAPDVERQWLEFEAVISQGALVYKNEIDIYALARQIWANEYGDEAARELPFYDVNQNIHGTMWWDALAEVTTTDLIAYLKGSGRSESTSTTGVLHDEQGSQRSGGSVARCRHDDGCGHGRDGSGCGAPYQAVDGG
jgi:hypothetical protein